MTIYVISLVLRKDDGPTSQFLPRMGYYVSGKSENEIKAVFIEQALDLNPGRSLAGKPLVLVVSPEDIERARTMA